MMLSEEPSSAPPAQSAEAGSFTPSSSFPPSFPPSAPTNDAPQTIDTSSTSEPVPARTDPVAVIQSDLSTLERAARAGNPSAQLRLAQAMRLCITVLAHSEESVQNLAEPLRRAYLVQSRNECQYFADRRDSLVNDAFEWTRRATDAGDPGARAIQVMQQVSNGELQADQAQRSLKGLLASNDPYVYLAVSGLSMTNAVNAESAAWRMLACEDAGPPEFCSIIDEGIAAACTGAARCGNTSYEVDMMQYYMHAHPALFDLARGRYQELKNQLQQGRTNEIVLHLTR